MRSLFLLVPSLLLVAGCPKKDPTDIAASDSDQGTTIQTQERTTATGDLVVEVDLDGDKRADIFNYYKTGSGDSKRLLRKEVDLNRDGHVDVWSFYDDVGELEREEMDSDFDGRVDWTDHYQQGKRSLSEVDTEANGTPDMFKYYETWCRSDKTNQEGWCAAMTSGTPAYLSSKIKKKERDTNADGRIDHWEYFDADGNVIKVGWDVDGDGVMDVRQE